MVVISFLLMLAALAGLALTVVSGSLFTVDGLFFSLILGLIALIFASNTLYELRRVRSRRREATIKTKAVAATAGPLKPTTAGKSAPADALAVPAKVSTEIGAEKAEPDSPILRRLRPVVEFAAKGERPAQRIGGLASGNVIIRDDAAVSLMGLPAEHYGDGWTVIASGNGGDLEGPLHAAGFEIFFLVQRVECSAFAFSREKAVRKAVEKLLGQVAAQQHNAVELKQLHAVNILGLQYVTVQAGFCQIQRRRFILEAQQAAEAEFAPGYLDDGITAGRAA